MKSNGITVNLLKSISTDRFCEVIFDNVAVDKKDILGVVDEAGDAIRKALQRAAIAKCAEMTGGAQKSLEMAVSYSKERQQFGKLIGTFQIIQHQCADIALDVKISSLMTYSAASLVSDGLSCAKQVSMAKAWVNEAYERVTYFATKVHGAIALTAAHTMPLYFKHAKASEPVYGDSDYHREIVAKEIGL
jgi:3-oxocholest-4-en-26-oyl-CoA dehydrogenase beta subunit